MSMLEDGSGRLALFWLVLALGAGPSPVQARQDEAQTRPDQEAQEEEPQVTLSEYVFVEGALAYVPRSNTIVTKLPLDHRSTPHNVGFVTEPLARERFDRLLSEALENVSNVNVQTQSGVADFFHIRGFDSLSSGLVLTDGAPEPEATRYQLYNVELVEVLKGPAGFLYGSNPLAGAVNLVRKQPLPAKLLRFDASGGSFDRYEGSLDWNYGSVGESIAFRLNGLLRDEGSYRDAKGGRTAAIHPAVSFRLGEGHRLNVSAEHVDLDYVPDAGIPVLLDSVIPVAPDTNYQSELDDSAQDVLRFQADYEWRATQWLSIRDKFYHRSLDWRTTSTLLNGVIRTGPLSLGVVRTQASLDDRQSFAGNQLEAVFSFETGKLHHSLLGGFELDRFADEFTLDAAVLPLVNAFRPVEPPGSAPIPLPDQSVAGDSRSIVAAPYFVDQIRWGKSLNVLLGGRLDAIDFEERLNNVARDGSELSPMAGVLYAATPELSLYGNYSRSFAPPSPRVVGEALPERGTQYEVGVKKRFATLRAETVLALYHLERDNIPIPDDNGFTQQVGNQRSRGVEIDVAAQPTSTLRAFFSYAFNEAELTSFSERVLVSLVPPAFATLDRSGNRPGFAPKHVMNLWMSKDITSRWGVGGGARYVSSQFIAEDNLFRIDSVLTFDAMAFYRLGSVRFRLNLKNLTDREYFVRGFGGSSVIPAPPFAAYVGLEYEM